MVSQDIINREFIIKALSENSPFSIDDISQVYNKTKSIDMTIEFIECAIYQVYTTVSAYADTRKAEMKSSFSDGVSNKLTELKAATHSRLPDKFYQQVILNVPIACVDIAIMHNSSVLLVKRLDEPAKGQWWLPGGRVYKGEMMVETAKRKALEEVGLDCEVGPLIYTAETVFEDGPNRIPVHSINSCFLLRSPDIGEIKLDSHHSAHSWFNAGNLKNDLHPYVIKCLLASFLNDRGS